MSVAQSKFLPPHLPQRFDFDEAAVDARVLRTLDCTRHAVTATQPMLHMELPALPATADANRIEGWTRYHDYFHRIERVMQVSWSACRAAAHHARPTILYPS